MASPLLLLLHLFGVVALLCVTKAQSQGSSGWSEAHATFYGGSDASGTMGRPIITLLETLKIFGPLRHTLYEPTHFSHLVLPQDSYFGLIFTPSKL